MKFKLILVINIATLLLTGCISRKKFAELQLRKHIDDSLMNVMIKQRDTSIRDLSIKNQILSKYIEKMSSDKIPIDFFLPIIPNPPPQSTSYLIFNEKKFNNLKTYGQVDSVLSEQMRSFYKTKIYLGFKGGGFAIATPIVQIRNKQTSKSTELADNDNLLDLFKYFFSQAHEKELFFPDFKYSQCLIFIVSPNLYTIGGPMIDGNEVQNWIDSGNFRLPDKIKSKPLHFQTQIVALLYEFESNANIKGQLKVIDYKNKFSDIENLPIIKALQKFR